MNRALHAVCVSMLQWKAQRAILSAQVFAGWNEDNFDCYMGILVSKETQYHKSERKLDGVKS